MGGITDLPVVELEEVTKTYPGPPPLTVLQPTSLKIYPGDKVAIVGPSGSGKSTLLSLLGLLDTATTGQVRIEGHAVEKLKDWQRTSLRSQYLGFVFQQFHLLPSLSAQENVETGLLYSNISRVERSARAKAALGRVGLGKRTKHRPQQLSGGEQQRVAIARALVRQPAVLFADEPTGALDSKTGVAVMELLRQSSAPTEEQSPALVVVTHDNDLAAQFDRQFRVLDGVVTESAGGGTK